MLPIIVQALEYIHKTRINCPSRELLENTIDRYSEPHRHYHTKPHLATVVGYILNIDLPSDQFDTRFIAWSLVAAIYHDSIYEARSSQNKADSAKLLYQHLLESRMHILKEAKAAHAAILATDSCRPFPIGYSGDMCTLLIRADLDNLIQSDYHTVINDARKIFVENNNLTWVEFTTGYLNFIVALDHRCQFDLSQAITIIRTLKHMKYDHIGHLAHMKKKFCATSREFARISAP